jgi:hypothetical protein
LFPIYLDLFSHHLIIKMQQHVCSVAKNITFVGNKPVIGWKKFGQLGIFVLKSVLFEKNLIQMFLYIISKSCSCEILSFIKSTSDGSIKYLKNGTRTSK